MRTALIIAVTTLVLACFFLVYVWFQPDTVSKTVVVSRPTTAPIAAPTTQFGQAGPMGTGPGEDVAFQMYDTHGELSSEFRAARFDPQPGNVVLVDKPQADFYLAGGQLLRINGVSGEVVVPDNGGRTDNRGMQGPPSRGKLSDVIIRLFPSEKATQPLLTCKVNNAAFDNETFRIVTEAFTDADGKRVEADQVPVEVRGVDYDFDGKGLLIRWNERDRKLQLLEIAHGNRLVIKNAAALGDLTSERQPSPFDPSQMIASADPAAAAQLVKPSQPSRITAPASRPTSRPGGAVSSSPYRAVFADNVRVLKGDKQVATSELMNADFLMSNTATTQPSVTTRPTKTAAKKPDPSTKPTKVAATTKPAENEPITVFWTGKLRVTPAPENVVIQTAGEMNIEMIGKTAPVALDWQDKNIRCASFSYRAGDKNLIVRNSTQYPKVTIHDAEGTNIESEGFQYSSEDGQTVMNGAGVADLQTVADAKDPKAPPQIMHATWSKSCVLVMPGDAKQNAITMESAKLEGDVTVDHPQMKLKAQSLDLAFAPSARPTTRPGKNLSLKGLDAHQDVHCTLISTDQVTNIESDALNVAMMPQADGSFIPQQLTADGHVHTHDDTQDLTAGRLEVGLGPAPTTKPSVEGASPTRMGQFQLNSIFAQQDVHIKTHDGTTADADQFDVEEASGQRRITLSKQPFATVTTADSTLRGQLIKLDPDAQTWEVVGPGTMSAVQKSTPESKPVPVHVKWKTGLLAETLQNRVDISGSVEMDSQSEDRTTTNATSEHLVMALADKPAPATKPSTKPSAKPAKAGATIGGSDLMASKSIKSITLSDDVKLNSITLAEDGSISRRVYLKAPVMRYEMLPPGPDGKGADQLARVVVPSAGQMLFEDRSPAAEPVDQNAAMGLGGMSGATAFAWDQQLIYEAIAQQAVMTGGVRIVHQSNDISNTTFHLDGDSVTADFEQTPTTQPSTRPANSMAGMASGIRPKLLHAEGNVHFSSEKVQFDAADLLFKPIEQTLIGLGNQSQPAVLFDANGFSQGTFRRIEYNMKTDQLSFRDFHALVRR